MEICAFLKEYACPYRTLLEGPIDERFKTIQNRLLLIDFLVTELQAARILASTKPESKELLHSQKSVVNLKFLDGIFLFPKKKTHLTVNSCQDTGLDPK